MPGHFLLYEQNGSRLIKYWELNIDHGDNYDEAYYKERIYEALKESVIKRLQSDVPVGVLLSGGLDSSAILGLMTQVEGKPVKSFSVGYSYDTKDKFSEFKYARKVSNYFKGEHHEVVVDWRKFIDYLPKAAWQEDEPISEDSAVPMHYVCKLAKDNGVTVLLSGEGSDEIFAGYNRHWGENLSKYYSMIPEPVRNYILGKLIHRLPRVPLMKKGHRSMTISNFNERFLSWHTVFTEDLKKELMINNNDLLTGVME
ncbi:unnamed protein product, partial [marine sediment metagenome]